MISSKKMPVFDWFFENGDVLVGVNSKIAGVEMPASLRKQDVVNFVLGVAPTPKLTRDEWGVITPMRFKGALFTCRFPWESIVQMSSQDAVIQFRPPSEAGTKNGKLAKLDSTEKSKRANLRRVK